MEFSIGYQFSDEFGNPLAEKICERHKHIAEVYFPWLDTSTCRASLVNENGMMNWQGQEALEFDLKKLNECGIQLNLLMNSNCYGEKAVSVYLENYCRSTVEHIIHVAGKLDIVTTTSPFIALVIKEHFPKVKTRASINMRIGTIEGMNYLKDRFDGFYILRDHNRDIKHLKSLKKWADAHFKTIHLLANSGCLYACSGQTFHDNTVAHEQTIAEYRNKKDFNPAICWDFFKNPENHVQLIKNTWIRPEDIHHYESLVPTMKLATRMTERPMAVINSYIKGKFSGNVLDLLEPNHTSALNGQYIRNTLFPDDWFNKTSTCSRNCEQCCYCGEALKKVLCKIPDVAIFDNEQNK